jgi:hypothetical protein
MPFVLLHLDGEDEIAMVVTLVIGLALGLAALRWIQIHAHEDESDEKSDATGREPASKPEQPR